MKYVYYLVKNQEIVQKFSEDNKEDIKTAYEELSAESNEVDDIQIIKVHFDVSVLSFSQLVNYGNDVTIEFIDIDDTDLFIL